jgi:hypothetical protein
MTLDSFSSSYNSCSMGAGARGCAGEANGEVANTLVLSSAVQIFVEIKARKATTVS